MNPKDLEVIEGPTNNPPETFYKERERLIEIIKAGQQARAELDILEHQYPMSLTLRRKL